MKPITKQSDRKAAFTIVELLTVISIIIILIGLLVPSLNMVKRYAKEVKQKAQFHSIDAALELFSGEWDGYPPSDAKDETDADYCGAMKLCEAMLGQDLMGFHPLSRFRADCKDALDNKLYDNNPPNQPLYPDTQTNLKARKTYLQQTSDAYRLVNLYGTGTGNTDPFDEDLYVLCDVYTRVKHTETGKKVGMPILYYKADTSGFKHDPNAANFPTATDRKDYVYNYLDNDDLALLPPPWDPTATHPLAGGIKFYEGTKDSRITIDEGRPYRPDSYILISAGFDGLYGTDDDIFNFEK